MKQIDRKPLGRVCGGLLALACLGASVAAGCGRVQTDDTGSETHWLARCVSDADCAEGSCECGVCSVPCDDAPPECARLGIAGVQCTREPSACGEGSDSQGGSAPASGGACLLPCTRDADCGALGAEAICSGERCELTTAGFQFDYADQGLGGTGGTAGASGGIGGQGGSADENQEIATLCDGSEDVRFTYVVEGGFVGPFYRFLAGPYGHRSFVIDGQCRFWHTRVADGWVRTGTMDPERAQTLARAIGYGHLSDYSDFEDPPCPDGNISTLAAPEGKIRCGCQCGSNPDAPAGWRTAFNTVTQGDELGFFFLEGETVTGPAQMVLLTPRNTTNGIPARTWPLARDPEDGEFVLDDQGGVFLTESSGVSIEDAAELAALRQLRAEFVAELSPGTSLVAVPVLWANASSGGQFDLFLRDEVPEKVRAALEGAQ